MSTTPASLLERLRRPGEQESWDRFVALYAPLIYVWGRRAGVPAEESADLVQDVLMTLVRKLPEFDYDPGRSFRGWLKAVTLNAWRARCRVRAVPIVASGAADLDGMAAPSDGEDDEDEREYRRHLAERALQWIRRDFEPTTWQAAWETLVAARPAADVAAALGISRNAVYIAKSRVLRRLYQELNGLLD